MALKVLSRFPGGNAAAVEVVNGGEIPEVRFASDPCGGTEAMWFYFRLVESDPDPAKHTKVKLTWTFFDNVPGGSDFSSVIPVSGNPGHTWIRLKQGDESRTPEGLKQLSWLVPHPAPTTDIALCFPYGPQDFEQLVSRSKDFWNAAPIGLSQGGRLVTRAYNTLGTLAANQPGIYVIARQHAGETPGSWVLDGFMRHWAQNRKGGYVIWTVPFADIDGVQRGYYGRGGFPADMNTAWGDPHGRHETLVIKNDIARWKERCRPILALDLHAPGAGDRDGVHAMVRGNGNEALAAEETKWCNVIRNELQAEYAASDFRRVYASPAADFVGHLRTLGVPALALRIPYSLAGTNILSQKNYREIGQRIANAVMKRKG